MNLFAVLSTLDTPAPHQHGALFAHQVSQALDSVSLYVANLFCPFGGLRHAIGLAEHIGDELIVTHGVLADEFAIHLTGSLEFIRHTEHHGNVGTGLRSDPLAVLAEVFGRVRLERVDGNHGYAGLLHHFHAFGVFMDGRHPVDVVGDRRIGTPHHKEFTFFCEHFPSRLLFVNAVGADHIGQDHLCATRGVVAVVAGKAAVEIEHTLHQIAGRTQIAGTHPTVAAAVDRHGTVLFSDTLEFGGNEFQSLVPGDAHEGFGAAALAASLIALFQITLANHRVADASGVVRLLCERLQLQRRSLVEFDRFESFDLAALDVNAVHAPMRSVHHFGVVQNGFAEIKRTRKLEFVLAL